MNEITEEDCKQMADTVVQHVRDKAERITELIASGYAGVLPNGNIVDRREYPTAVAIQKNTLLHVPATQ